MSVKAADGVQICLVCGWSYSERDGHPESGVAPGSSWDEVPHDWVCPECGVGKDDFTRLEG